jgi:hypothetical protein
VAVEAARAMLSVPSNPMYLSMTHSTRHAGNCPVSLTVSPQSLEPCHNTHVTT